MKILPQLLGYYFKLKYRISTSDDRQKYLLKFINYDIDARGGLISINQEKRFIREEELQRFSLRIHSSKNNQVENKPTPPIDSFRKNTALFLTYPGE